MPQIAMALAEVLDDWDVDWVVEVEDLVDPESLSCPAKAWPVKARTSMTNMTTIVLFIMAFPPLPRFVATI